MANLAAKHHHGERHPRSHDNIPLPVDLYHVPVSVDHYRVIPKKESRAVFDSDGRLAEAYEVKKKIQEGELRLERHTGAGVQTSTVRAPPKKGGKGGKFTWEGQYNMIEQEEAPHALDAHDPNYDEGSAEPGLRKKKPKKKGERGTIGPPWEKDQEGVVKEEKVGLGGKTEGLPPEELGGGVEQLDKAKELAEQIGEGDRVLSAKEVDKMVHGVDISEFLSRAVDQMHMAAEESQGEGQEQELPDISQIVMPDPGKYAQPELLIGFKSG